MITKILLKIFSIKMKIINKYRQKTTSKSLFIKLLNLYKKYGYTIRTGLSPYHYSAEAEHVYDLHTCFPFSYIYKNYEHINTGGGISPQEIYFIETLFEKYHPKNIFIIGNAFGWSTFALTLANPKSNIIAIDACCEGEDSIRGFKISKEIIEAEHLNTKVIKAKSPEDTKRVVCENFVGNLDFVFIDGLHTNEQLLLDFNETKKYASKNCIYLFHDIINWKMGEAFEKITQENDLESYILHRTTSGMGIMFSKDAPMQVRHVVDAFSETQMTVQGYHCLTWK